MLIALVRLANFRPQNRRRSSYIFPLQLLKVPIILKEQHTEAVQKSRVKEEHLVVDLRAEFVIRKIDIQANNFRS